MMAALIGVLDLGKVAGQFMFESTTKENLVAAEGRKSRWNTTPLRQLITPKKFR
jgi:hypothetical protein